jgi:hypothetical protein
VLVEAFAPHLSLEARGDGEDGRGGELGAVVADDHARPAAARDQRRYLAHHPFLGLDVSRTAARHSLVTSLMIVSTRN